MNPCAVQPDVTEVVRMVLRPPFDPNHPNRDIKFKRPTPNDDDDDANNDGTPNIATTGGPLDINLIQMDQANGKDAEIRVILKDTARWKFYDTDPIHGIGMTDPDDPMALCGAH